VSFQSNSKGAARSGGIFFFTKDGAYMIKTIPNREKNTLLQILPKYHEHMKRYGRSSLLTRFCGMYEKEYTFIVMNAVFPPEANKFISERFDLKGSTVGREVSEEELKSKGSQAVLKDLDLCREHYSDAAAAVGGFTIGATAKAALLSQLRKDVKLLIDCQVMDYSLLVGIILERLEGPSTTGTAAANTNNKKILITVDTIVTYPMPYYGSGICGVDGGQFSVMHGKRKGHRAIYYMGLIDFLQPWSTRKVFERKLKGLAGYDTTAISAVTPEEYATRFLDFLDQNIN
ncbi:SAICAR synthase-like protein, partial [Fragilariopsis cylindrus CCMP1102]